MNETKTSRIAQLNDVFRSTLIWGRVMLTQGVAALPEADQDQILAKVREFNQFTEDNDPHGEHDFGAFEHAGRRFFWKLDYYDKAMTFGSEDPSDPSKTTRILTVLFSDEY